MRPVLLRLQQNTGITDHLRDRFLYEDELLLDFLLLNRWNSGPLILTREMMIQPHSDETFGDPFLEGI